MFSIENKFCSNFFSNFSLYVHVNYLQMIYKLIKIYINILQKTCFYLIYKISYLFNNLNLLYVNSKQKDKSHQKNDDADNILPPETIRKLNKKNILMS